MDPNEQTRFKNVKFTEYQFGTDVEINAIAYSLLFEVENGLRELIIKLMHESFGSNWMKNNLPGDVRETIKRGKQSERGISWISRRSYHPMYYADFPDLRKVMVQGQNWKMVFEQIIGQKMRIESRLSDLEPVRNKIAHCRVADYSNIQLLEGVHGEVETYFGCNISALLAQRLPQYAAMPDRLQELRLYFMRTKVDMVDGRTVADYNALESLSREWWFEEVNLEEYFAPIQGALRLISDYQLLNFGRGSAYLTKEWLREKSAYQIVDAGIDAVVSVIEQANVKI